ncbi:MAG: YceI family protein [Planctomycetales bacterium]|nr:YceI family protein [Planctomycetales bacterium]
MRQPHILYASFFTVLTLLAAPGQLAAQSTGAATAAPQYQLGDINIESSRVYTKVFKSTSIGHEHGVEGRLQRGRISLGSTGGSGELVFDLRTFRADTDTARKYVGLSDSTDAATAQKVNQNMLGGQVLNTGKFPTAVFTIQSSTAMPEPSQRGLLQYRLDGVLELHGVKRQLSVLADVTEQNGWTHLRGGFKLKQTDFGITPFSKAFGAIGVADVVTVYGDFWVAGTPQQMAQRATQQR